MKVVLIFIICIRVADVVVLGVLLAQLDTV